MNEAKKDAKRWAEAKMNYGTGAGIKRRHLKAELDKKLQNDAYRAAFEDELERVNYDRIIRDVNIRNKTKNAAVNGKKVFKNVVKAGTLAAGAYAFYSSNREGIDRIANGVKVKIKNAINKRKYKKHTKVVSMSDAEKAAAYLESVGIKANYK